MKTAPYRERTTVPEELLNVLVDRAVRQIRPVISEADLEQIRTVVFNACQSDPVLLLLLNHRES
jgi:hypothetical protein